jgi:dihydrofolate reductase
VSLAPRDLDSRGGCEGSPLWATASPSVTAGENHLWVVGGGNVASQFADEGLLDEVLVTVVSVVLGDGKPLFDRRLAGGPMRLVGVSPRSNGMVQLGYEVRR